MKIGFLSKKPRIISLLLAVCMLISCFPLTAAAMASDDNYESVSESASGSESTVETDQADSLTQGDLSVDALADKTLSDDEFPDIISREDIAANKNVHRLYQQETDLNSVVFQNSDATKTMYYFEDAVKYIDSDGTTKDKSNTLYSEILDEVYQMEYGLVNAENDIKTYFPNVLSDATGIILTAEGITIEMHSLPGNGTAPANSAPPAELREDNYVYYSGSFGNGAALRYTPTYTGVKEDIVLERDIGVYEFSYLVSAKGLNAIQDGNFVNLYDKDGIQVAEFPDILIYDSADEQNISFLSTVSVMETENPDEFIYTIHADRDFIQSEETVYPVYIDPTLRIDPYGTTKFILDATISHGVPNATLGGNSTTFVGYYDKNYKACRTLMRFPGLLNNDIYKSLPASRINSLKLHLYVQGGASSSNVAVNIYNGPVWDESRVTYNNASWNGASTFISSLTPVGNTYNVFNLTHAVSTWKANLTVANQGIILSNSNDVNSANRKVFFSTEGSSSNRPYLTMEYDDKFTVTLDRNGGTSGATSFTATINSSTLTGYSAPARSGYTFDGYWTEKSGGYRVINKNGSYESNVSGYTNSSRQWIRTTTPTTLYARWTPNSYTVTLNRNGGTTGATSFTATMDSPTLSGYSKPTLTGYAFDGYWTAASGGYRVINYKR